MQLTIKAQCNILATYKVHFTPLPALNDTYFVICFVQKHNAAKFGSFIFTFH